MTDDPEWQRIRRMGHEAKETSQAITKLGFFFMIACSIISYMIVNIIPYEYQKTAAAVAFVITSAIIVVTLFLIFYGMKLAFKERDEAMKAYFDKEETSGD